MSALLWRVIIAVVCVLLAFALIPPVLDVFGFPASGSVLQILRICIGGIALLYILRGGPPTLPT